MTTQPATNNTQQTTATGIGFIAIALWSTLALFTALTNAGEPIPPFQLLAMTFVIGAFANTLLLAVQGKLSVAAFIAPKKAWLLSVSGLFFYHFFYFLALARAPEIEAGLINYLWPLLIVLFSALLPGERLRWYHCVGGLLSFLGVLGLVLLNGKGFDADPRYLLGYAFSVASALVWSSYSVANRRFAAIPSSATVGFCFMVALLALLSHFVFGEPQVMPNRTQWIGVIGLGIGPVGLAFFVWDYGTKHGNIQLLGILSYFAPLFSTILLVIFTDSPLTTGVIVGCAGILIGAMIAVLPAKLKKM